MIKFWKIMDTVEEKTEMVYSSDTHDTVNDTLI